MVLNGVEPEGQSFRQLQVRPRTRLGRPILAVLALQ